MTHPAKRPLDSLLTKIYRAITPPRWAGEEAECLNFSFQIERECVDKKTGKCSLEVALGITSRTPQEASPQRVLEVNRGHWAIESVHYIIDWNYDEDRGRARTGFGPENLTHLRRFAVGILKSFQKPAQSIAEMMRILCFRNRIVFDYLRMTKNSAPTPLGA